MLYHFGPQYSRRECIREVVFLEELCLKISAGLIICSVQTVFNLSARTSVAIYAVVPLKRDQGSFMYNIKKKRCIVFNSIHVFMFRLSNSASVVPSVPTLPTTSSSSGGYGNHSGGSHSTSHASHPPPSATTPKGSMPKLSQLSKCQLSKCHKSSLIS